MAERELVLVIDFGAQYAQLIARRVRQANVYSEIIPSNTSVSEIIARNPKAIILSGGPASVYEVDAPTIDKALFKAGIPIFGICYGFQVMAQSLGGAVDKTGNSEYGRTIFKAQTNSKLLTGLSNSFNVWMSHGDSVVAAPAGFSGVGATEKTPIAAFENETGLLSGVQFHPEVLHTENGQVILQNWLVNTVGCKPSWTSGKIAEAEVAKVRALVGSKHAICGLSGGVDSAVAAAIVQKAIGSQLTCVFVDHGLLRKGEAEQVEQDFEIGRAHV